MLKQAAALQREGRLAEAERLHAEILRAEPEHLESLRLLGVLRHQQGRHEEAIALIERALAGEPSSAPALSNLGSALHSLGRHAEALAAYDRAIAIGPASAEILNNRGNALQALGRHADALAAYDRALALRPGYARALNHRGAALTALNRVAEAAASFAAATAIEPGYAEAHLNHAFARLALGDCENGWRLLEWRWEVPGFALPGWDVSRPRWSGREDLRGKTLFLHREQGFGDTLQFVRYAPLAARRGARVILGVQPALKALAAGLDGVEQAIAEGEPLPAFDLHCPLMSLPYAFGTTLDTIPAQVPYLAPPPERLAAWRARLGGRRMPRAGIAWAGNPDQANDRNRSIPLAQLLTHLRRPGIEWISLQKEIREPDAAAFAGCGFVDLRAGLGDFADTAAVIALLDLVVAADSAVAHLAGALGKPVWVLLPFAAGWRWMLDRDDSPWYPSARLFRQPAPGDWDAPLERVGRELAALERPA